MQTSTSSNKKFEDFLNSQEQSEQAADADANRYGSNGFKRGNGSAERNYYRAGAEE